MNINNIFAIFFRIVKGLLWILIIIVALGILLPYIRNVNSYSYLRPVIKIDKAINPLVSKVIPTNFAGHDFSSVISLIILLIISAFIQNIVTTFRNKADKERMTEELNAIEQQSTSSKQKLEIEELKEKIQSTNLKGKSRAALLKEFSVIKRELEKTGRNLAFLAIDVVGSTEMKREEDPVTVESDFNEYHNFILAKFQKYGYIKASWTPDGVMACFNNTEQAIQAAQSIIDDLVQFNNNVKMMKRDFSVRCGINSGFVYYDVSTPLEEFSDRVIDIAGHMQKHASPNTILVAKDMVEPVAKHGDFTKTAKIVDSLEAYEWHPSMDK
jgi:class 3 adenylate cyclase